MEALNWFIDGTSVSGLAVYCAGMILIMGVLGVGQSPRSSTRNPIVSAMRLRFTWALTQSVRDVW